MATVVPAVMVAHAIQLAVAPVFLLNGIGAILSVLTGRLSRIIDRSRVLHNRRLAATEGLHDIDFELQIHAKRAWNINWAISLSTVCALLVCLVIALLFLEEIVSAHVELPVALLFVAAMACLILALLFFLREIYLATARFRVGP